MSGSSAAPQRSSLVLRLLVGAVGVVVGCYGAFLALDERLDQLVPTVVWMGGGVIAHDFVLVPVVLLVGLAGSRLLPTGWRAPVAGGFVVLGTVTVVAVPFLGRFGEIADNPTLLDRDYTVGYLVLAGLVVIGVVLVRVASAMRSRGRPEDLSAPLDDTPVP